ncbi:uncharacterized protein BX663DRAFT_517699 [Cokeromyces recurvatus]|uniref:uncharacterized protein n=1 Tax=Cokeromyces recurvatus TaxID=90255 RepID=UPI00221F1102|nr:uncharacterized protein BX663DRAFT_517699 [Cokeromyces recurvatus]KAI7900459.1 hypothetical protein BX663DRAFT_517699 [Cokeromyces recurvatus]
MSKEVTHDESNLKELTKSLSDAYCLVLQYSTQNQQQITSSLKHLSKYSNDLPTSWFTPQFLDALLSLEKRFLNEPHFETLSSIFSLFSSWMRRLSSTKDVRLPMIMDSVLKILLVTDNRYLSIQKDAFIGWVSLIGKDLDTQLLEGMTKVFELYTTFYNEERTNTMLETLNASLAHTLAQTNTLNDFEVEACQKLLNAYIKFAAKKWDGPRTMMTAIEHAVDVRAQEKPQTRAEVDLTTLVNMVIDTLNEKYETHLMSFTSFAALAGVVRMLQFSQGKKTNRILELRKQSEKAFIRQFDTIIDTVMSTKYVNEYYANQDIVSFFACRCIIQIPKEIILQSKNISTLLKILTSSLLTSPHAFNNGELLHRLENTPSMVEEVKQLINQPLYKDIGRISRAMAKLIKIVLIEDQAVYEIQTILDRLVGFSYNTFFDWDRYKINMSEKSMSVEESKNKENLEAAIWTLFKSILFAFTVILKSIAVDIPIGQGFSMVSNAAQDIISTYANLNFITEHLGEGAGRQAYQETLTNAVAYLLHEDNHCQLNKLLSSAFKEYAPSQYSHNGKPSIELLSIVNQSRLTFFTDLIEQVMKAIDDKVLENDILPVIYPILKWKNVKNKNLYESVHTVVITAFVTEKPVSRELAGVYSKILIENFPEPMSLDQFRFAFNSLIQTLCSMDDALAWLTVNQLIEKIYSLNSEEDIVLRNEYITALIDLLKPLSLGPFFQSILDEIEKMIFAQETSVMQKATMKILFETVSGPGISDMRRTEAVGWFLKLKRQLKL